MPNALWMEGWHFVRLPYQRPKSPRQLFLTLWFFFGFFSSHFDFICSIDICWGPKLHSPLIRASASITTHWTELLSRFDRTRRVRITSTLSGSNNEQSDSPINAAWRIVWIITIARGCSRWLGTGNCSKHINQTAPHQTLVNVVDFVYGGRFHKPTTTEYCTTVVSYYSSARGCRVILVFASSIQRLDSQIEKYW